MLLRGADDDRYTFLDGWGRDTILEDEGGGTDTLDFSAVTSALVAAVGGPAEPSGLTVTAGAESAAHDGDNIENIGELGGYGPFLLAAAQKDDQGRALFPETFGGGLGVERCLFALCLGEKIRQVDQMTLFGKNPDSYPLYLF